ncbi:MAG: YibE/F family protein [Anaerovoracaceae bacterium]
MNTLMRQRKYLILIALAAVFVLLLFWCNNFTRADLRSTKGQTYEQAVVTAIVHDNLAEDGNRYGSQTVRVKLTSGSQKGKTYTAVSPSGQLFGATCKKGMHVIVIVNSTAGNSSVTVYSQNRIGAILAFLAVFAAAVCLVGGRKGAMALLSLAFAFVCIFGLMLPAIYRGVQPVLIAIAVAAATTLVTLALLNGFSRKTAAAIIGTSGGVVAAGVAALLFGRAAGISGYNVASVETLSFVAQYAEIHIGQLLFAGIIISSLGAVMDVGMSIASTLEEVHAANPRLDRRELFRSGIRVGRDMIGTMTNTLIFAFVGGSLSTLLINYAYNLSFYQLINSFNIGIEIMQGLSGSLGVVLTVPITALISSALLTRAQRRDAAEETAAPVSAPPERSAFGAGKAQPGNGAAAERQLAAVPDSGRR